MNKFYGLIHTFRKSSTTVRLKFRCTICTPGGSVKGFEMEYKSSRSIPKSYLDLVDLTLLLTFVYLLRARELENCDEHSSESRRHFLFKKTKLNCSLIFLLELFVILFL